MRASIQRYPSCGRLILCTCSAFKSLKETAVALRVPTSHGQRMSDDLNNAFTQSFFRTPAQLQLFGDPEEASWLRSAPSLLQRACLFPIVISLRAVRAADHDILDFVVKPNEIVRQVERIVEALDDVGMTDRDHPITTNRFIRLILEETLRGSANQRARQVERKGSAVATPAIATATPAYSPEFHFDPTVGSSAQIEPSQHHVLTGTSPPRSGALSSVAPFDPIAAFAEAAAHLPEQSRSDRFASVGPAPPMPTSVPMGSMPQQSTSSTGYSTSTMGPGVSAAQTFDASTSAAFYVSQGHPQTSSGPRDERHSPIQEIPRPQSAASIAEEIFNDETIFDLPMPRARSMSVEDLQEVLSNPDYQSPV